MKKKKKDERRKIYIRIGDGKEIIHVRYNMTEGK